MTVRCPCCLWDVSTDAPLYLRERCPVMNNVVYATYKQARACRTGVIRLVQCSQCGLVFNAAYDENLIAYNELYDNARNHSGVYRRYLDSIVTLCAPKINRDHIILEIGCGNGDFLKKLSDTIGCQAMGYDTTYEGDPIYRGKVAFRKQYFDPCHDQTSYHTIILRHVLEHLPTPDAIFNNLFNHSLSRVGTQVIIEVPDWTWIVQKNAFYDITYEHCNYFSPETLAVFMERVGIVLEKMTTVFERQYLFAQGRYEGHTPLLKPSESVSNRKNVREEFCAAKQQLIERLYLAETVCVWGASGKGVLLLSDLPEETLRQITYVVDINPAKQGKFLPVSGKKVDNPDVLKSCQNEMLVLIMNPIYEPEIFARLHDMGVAANAISLTEMPEGRLLQENQSRYLLGKRYENVPH